MAASTIDTRSWLEEDESVAEGRLFWWLLPLLALCSCSRKGRDADDVNNNASAPTDRQPVSSSEDTVTPKNAVPKEKTVPKRSTVPKGNTVPRHSPTRGGRANCASENELTRIERYARSIHLTTESDCSRLQVIPRIHSLADDDGSSIDQFSASDLPLLPLLVICGHLRTDGRCQDLFNFRRTCRSFARAANIFFEDPSNLPAIEDLSVSFNADSIHLIAHMQAANYLMHPARANRAVLKGETDRWRGPLTCFESSVAFHDVQKLESAAESLCGPVGALRIGFNDSSREIDKVLTLLRNITFSELHCSGNFMTSEMGSLILALIRDQSNPAVFIFCERTEPLGILAFLDRLLYSSPARHVILRHRQWTPRPRPLLGLSDAFWQQWLQQLQFDGCSYAHYSSDHPATIEWRK